MDTVSRRAKIARRIAVYGVIPLLLTLLSVFHIRLVPTVFGNLCGPNGDELCYEPLPQAGFPFAYWLDQGGISVVGHLGSEDYFAALAFGADFLVYVLIVTLAVKMMSKWRKRRQNMFP